jgi:hypothetical protein
VQEVSESHAHAQNMLGNGWDDELPPMEDLLELEWWLPVLELCDESLGGFYDLLLGHFYYGTQLSFAAVQLMAPGAKHLLSRMVHKSTTLTELEVTGESTPAQYTAIDAAASLSAPLAAALASSPAQTLTALHLTACGVDWRGARALARGLLHSAVTELGLVDNSLGPRGLAALAEAILARPEGFLEHLMLAGNCVTGTPRLVCARAHQGALLVKGLKPPPRKQSQGSQQRLVLEKCPQRGRAILSRPVGGRSTVSLHRKRR